MKVLFIFTEGPHDAHFLSRVLRASCGYKVYDGKIGDFPGILPSFLRKRFEDEQAAHGAWSMKKLQQGVIPRLELALESADSATLALFFVCNGDARARDVTAFLVKLREALKAPFGPPPHLGSNARPIDDYAIVLCYDADGAGVNARMTRFRDEYQAHFGDLSSLRERVWLEVSFKLPSSPSDTFVEHVACIVLRAHGQERGTLEDVVIPLLRIQRGKELDAAEAFIADNMWDDCKLKGATSSDAFALETKQKKAALTALGQFDHPSASLAVFLARTQLIGDKDVLDDPVCQSLAALLSRMP